MHYQIWTFLRYNTAPGRIGNATKGRATEEGRGIWNDRKRQAKERQGRGGAIRKDRRGVRRRERKDRKEWEIIAVSMESLIHI